VEEKALRAGAAASLQKPIRIESLVQAMEEVLGTASHPGEPKPQ